MSEEAAVGKRFPIIILKAVREKAKIREGQRVLIGVKADS